MLISACCKLKKAVGFLFKRWARFSPAGGLNSPDPGPPDLILPQDDSSWTPTASELNDFKELAYTNLHVSPNGTFHLADRVYNANNDLMYEAGPPVFNPAAEWLVVDDDGNLYAIDHTFEIDPNSEDNTYGWIKVDVYKHDAVTHVESLIHTKNFTMKNWPGFSPIGGGFTGPPKRELIDVRYGYLIYGGPGATFFQPSIGVRFDGNSFITLVRLSDGAVATNLDLYTGQRAHLDAYYAYLEQRGLGAVQPEYSEVVPVMVRICEDRGVYATGRWTNRGMVALQYKLPWVVGGDFFDWAWANWIGSRGGMGTAFACYSADVDDVFTIGWDMQGYYGRWHGIDKEVENTYCQGEGGHFDVDAEGNVVLSLLSYHPVYAGPVTTMVRLKRNALASHNSATTAKEDYFVNDDGEFVTIPYETVVPSGVGYVAAGYEEEWLVYDDVADNQSMWLMHDMTYGTDARGAWYRDTECLRRTNGVIAPFESQRWGFLFDSCTPATPHIMQRGGENSSGPTSGRPYTATDGQLVFPPTNSCPECDEDAPPPEYAKCCVEYLPCDLQGHITAGGETLSFRFHSSSCRAMNVPGSGRKVIAIASWGNSTSALPGCCCAREPAVGIACIELEGDPGVYYWRLSASYKDVLTDTRVTNYYWADPGATCSPFQVTFSNVTIDPSCPPVSVAATEIYPIVTAGVLPKTLSMDVALLFGTASVAESPITLYRSDFGPNYTPLGDGTALIEDAEAFYYTGKIRLHVPSHYCITIVSDGSGTFPAGYQDVLYFDGYGGWTTSDGVFVILPPTQGTSPYAFFQVNSTMIQQSLLGWDAATASPIAGDARAIWKSVHCAGGVPCDLVFNLRPVGLDCEDTVPIGAVCPYGSREHPVIVRCDFSVDPPRVILVLGGQHFIPDSTNCAPVDIEWSSVQVTRAAADPCLKEQQFSISVTE